MEHQLEFRQSLFELNQPPSRIGLILKAHHEIIAVTHYDDSSARVALPPLMDP
jgi:hypothetical protein